MNNQLQVFNHVKFGQIRIIDQNGDPFFVAMDIASSLGYANPSEAIRDHCKKVNKITVHSNTARTAQDDPPISYLIIPESDVYRLVMRSQLPNAIEFQDWVCEEVLPSIRKHGYYNLNADANINHKLSDIVESASIVFRLAGLAGNQLALACDKVHKANTGQSALEVAKIELVAPVQEKGLIPTELANMLNAELGYNETSKDLLTSRKINKLLLKLGLQDKTATGHKLTDLGKDFAYYVDTGKKHSNGTPVQQIKWHEKTVDFLLDNLNQTS